jgi:hypothetical protein
MISRQKSHQRWRELSLESIYKTKITQSLPSNHGGQPQKEAR